MANFEIILLALIAVFIFLRLRSVLGSRDGEEQNRNHVDPFARHEDQDQERDNVVHLPGMEPADLDEQQPVQQPVAKPAEPTGPAANGLKAIMERDETFNQVGFEQGAQGAFDMIISAFAQGDRDTLKGLLNPEVYGNFEQAIAAREAANEILENTLVGINQLQIIEAGMSQNIASVTVKIVSEQVNVTKDSAGEIVDGDPNYIDTITDIWTFERDVTSSNPNWYLVATEVA